MHKQYREIEHSGARQRTQIVLPTSPIKKPQDLPYNFHPGHNDFHDVLFWARLAASQSRKSQARLQQEARALQTLCMEEAYLIEFFKWRRSEAFTPREKAAMELSEALSREGAKKTIAKLLENARHHFTTQEMIHLTLSIRAVNDWYDAHVQVSPVILIIQENVAEQNILRKQLSESHANCRPVFVRKAKDALRMLTGPKQQLLWAYLLAVVIDIRMPHISGADLLQRIRRIPGGETLPVTVMTTSMDPLDIDEYERLREHNQDEMAVPVESCSAALAHVLEQNCKVVAPEAEAPKLPVAREANLGQVYERLRDHFQGKAQTA